MERAGTNAAVATRPRRTGQPGRPAWRATHAPRRTGAATARPRRRHHRRGEKEGGWAHPHRPHDIAPNSTGAVPRLRKAGRLPNGTGTPPQCRPCPHSRHRDGPSPLPGLDGRVRPRLLRPDLSDPRIPGPAGVGHDRVRVVGAVRRRGRHRRDGDASRPAMAGLLATLGRTPGTPPPAWRRPSPRCSPRCSPWRRPGWPGPRSATTAAGSP